MSLAEFQVSRGPASICGDLRLQDGEQSFPAAVFLTDILLSRRSGFYPFLCEGIAVERLVLGFDPSSSGYGWHREEDAEGRSAPKLELDISRSREYCLSQELADLVAVVRALCERRLQGSQRWDGERLALVGHGKGAALALHGARRLAIEGLPCTGVVLISAPSTLVREGTEAADAENAAAEIRVPVDPKIAAGVEEVVLGSRFLEDARRLEGQASLSELMATTEVPVLLVAGEEDPVFPVKESETLLAAGHPQKDRLVVIERAGHRFGSGLDFQGETAELAYLRDTLHRFLRESEKGRVPQDEGGSPAKREEMGDSGP